MGGESPEVRTVNTQSRDQRGVSNLYSQYLQGAVGQPGQAYPGPLVTSLSDLTQFSLGSAGEFLRSLPALEGETGGMLERALSGDPTSQIDPAMSAEQFQQSVYNPAMTGWREDILPSIRESFVPGGTFWGSERARAETGAGRRLAETLSGQRASWVRSDMEADRGLRESAANRALQAGPLAMAYGNQPLDRAVTGANLGMLETNLEQARLTAQYQDWLRTLAENQPQMAQALQFLGLTQTGTYGIPGQMGVGEMFGYSLAGGLGAGIGGMEAESLQSLIRGLVGGG